MKTFLLIGLLTTHLVSDNNVMNNENYLVGIQHGPAVLATMKNSYQERSIIGAYHWEGNEWFGAYVGVASGYESLHVGSIPANINGLAPIVAPYVKYENVKITLMGEVVNISLEIPIGRAKR